MKIRRPNKGFLSLGIGIAGACVLAVLVVLLASRFHPTMTRELLLDSILVTNMISVAISLFAFSRYVVLRERLIEFIALAFLIGGFIRIAGIIVSDLGIFWGAENAFYFQLAAWQGGKFLFALMLSVGTLLVWIFPKSKSVLLDVFAAVVIASVIVFTVIFISNKYSIGGQISFGNLRPLTLLASVLFLISFVGVGRNYLKYPTLFNYSVSITLLLLAFACIVDFFSASVTDTASTAEAGVVVLAYLIGAIGSLIDVGQIFNEYVRSSERLKAANQELQKYEIYVEKVPDPILITNEESLTLYTNPAFEENFGFSLSEIRERGIDHIYDLNNRENASQYERLVNEGESGELELTVVRSDGRKIEALLNSAPIIIDGEHLGRITIFRDITRRKQLEHRSQVLSAAVENTDEAIALTDPDGRVTILNPAAEKLFGYSLDELKDKNLWTLVSPSFGYTRAREVYVRTLRNGSWKGEVLNRKKDGSEYYISLNTSSIKDSEGRVIALVGICEDITEKKWEEKRKEAVYRVAQLAVSSGRLSDLAQSSSELLSELLNAPLVVMYFNDEKNTTLELAGQYNILKNNLNLPIVRKLKGEPRTDATRAVKSCKTIISQSLSGTEYAGFASSFPDANSLVSIPLMSSGDIIGVVQYLTAAATGSKEHETKLAEVAASELAVGVQRLRLASKIAEQADQLEKIFASAAEGIILVNRLGRILLMNEGGKGIFGIRDIPEIAFGQYADVFGMRRLDGTPLPDDVNPIKLAALDGKNIRNFEVTIIRLGMVRVLSISASPLIDAAGSLSGAVAIFSDITDRKGNEERIAYQAMLLREVNDAIIAADRNGKITSWNPAAERLYGWKAEEVVGLPYNEVIKFGYQGITRDKVEKELQRNNFWRGEVTNYSKNGKELYIGSSMALVRDSAGTSTGTVSINRDITEQKKNEIAIKKQNKRLSVINTAAFAVRDALEVSEILNKSLKRLLEGEDVSAAAVYLLHEGSDNLELTASLGFSPKFEKAAYVPSSSKGLLAEVMNRGEAEVIPELEKAIDRSEILKILADEMMSTATIVPVIGTRKPHGVLVTTSKERQDITQADKEFFMMISRVIGAAVENAFLYADVLDKSKELEDSNEQLRISKVWVEEANAQLVQANQQLEESSRLKSQFLANMSHELRTPLNSIIGFTNLILTDETQRPTGDQKEGLDIVLRNAKNLLALINDILDLSKIEAGRMTVSVEEFKIDTVIGDALATIEPLVGDKPVKVFSEIDSAVPSIQSDPARIKQVILNLLSNASKFTDEGHIKVAAKMLDENFVSIAVEDTGTGIPPQFLEVVFEEFRQVDGSNTRRHGGTGLGLAISRKLSRMLGGDLTVQSEIGKGSTFMLTVPVTYNVSEKARMKEQAGTLSAPATFSSEEASGQARNLVVCIDDDPEVLLLLKNHLVAEGFEFYGVADSRNAINVVRQYKPVLVTLDILMPNKDGWQILQELKSDPDLKEIPVVIHTVIENKALAVSLGAESYLVKPVPAEKIVSVIRKCTGTDEGEILVVDDNEDFTNFLRNLLEKSKFTIYTAKNGIEAVKLLHRAVPRLVFLDLLMPEMDGFEVVEKMHKDEKLREVPIVVLTAKEVSADERAKLNSKIKNVVQKEGLTRETILREVNKFIQRKKWASD